MKPDACIHIQRLEDETILQFMLKHDCLKDITLLELKDLANGVGCLVRNIRFNWKNNNFPSKTNLTDEIANSQYFITDLLFEKYAGVEQGKRMRK